MNEAIRAVIVDDEELARRGLEIRLADERDVEICGQCRNGREAVATVRDLKPDLVFLDVQMPGMDGFETLEQIAGPAMPAVIFVTAFAEHAIRAFEANAVDYLLKPIDDRRLGTALDRVRQYLATRDAATHCNRLLNLICEITGEKITLDDALSRDGALPQARPMRLAIKEGRTTEFVPIRDVDCIEAAGDYLCIHAAGRTHVMRGTMKRMEAMLDPAVFARTHRSTIVNLGRVRAVRTHTNGEYFLALDGDREVKVSRNYRDCVRRIAVNQPGHDSAR